jgi:hypothetical protein
MLIWLSESNLLGCFSEVSLIRDNQGKETVWPSKSLIIREWKAWFSLIIKVFTTSLPTHNVMSWLSTLIGWWIRDVRDPCDLWFCQLTHPKGDTVSSPSAHMVFTMVSVEKNVRLKVERMDLDRNDSSYQSGPVPVPHLLHSTSVLMTSIIFPGPVRWFRYVRNSTLKFSFLRTVHETQ